MTHDFNIPASWQARIAQEGLELPDEAPPVSERTKLVTILWIIVVGSLSVASGALAYGWLH